MNQPNVTQAEGIKDPVFDNGNDAARRLTDPTVAVIITVNLDVKRGQRTLSCNAPLHEIPLLRRMYMAIGGTVSPNPHWLPGLHRRAKLSHSQLQDELKRLSEKYVIPTESGKRDIMAEIYGATASERLRNLRDKMIAAHRLWADAESVAMRAIRASGLKYHPSEVEALIADRLTGKDIDRIIRALDPAEVTADMIELTSLDGGDALLRPADAGAPTPTDGEAATDPGARLSLAETFGGTGEDDPAEVKDEPTGIADSDLDPADLTEADVLIANLRQDGIEAAQAHQVALIVTATPPGGERADRLREAGFKAKALGIINKRVREYDNVAAPVPGAKR